MNRGRLDVSARALRDVRDMMVLERGDGYVLRGKTGWVFSTTTDVGWWIGSVEGRHGTSTFALNLDITDPATHPAARVAIGRAILAELGAFNGQ
jgi:beta-lactamase class D